MIRVGIDFDNTIVNYEGIFHKAAVDLGWMPASVGTSKQAVKHYFIDRNEEPRWTELQGVVYGKAIRHAKPYEGLTQALVQMKTNNTLLFVVSHKTQYPIIGDKLDFHAAARLWLANNGLERCFDQVYFCVEKDEKVQQIADLHLDWFIDDLPSILAHPHFPDYTQGVLFDPDHQHADMHTFQRVTHWSDVPSMIRVI